MKVICFVVIALLFLAPLFPEMFGMTLGDINTLQKSENINQIEGAITTGVTTIGTVLNVFGVLAEAHEFIVEAPITVFRAVVSIVKGWVT